MPYVPQTGIGATLTLGGVVYRVRSMNMSAERMLIDNSSLADFYTTNVAARITFNGTAEIFLSADAPNAIAVSYQNQSALGTVQNMVYSDASGQNVYTGTCHIHKWEHMSKSDDVEMFNIEFTASGNVT